MSIENGAICQISDNLCLPATSTRRPIQETIVKFCAEYASKSNVLAFLSFAFALIMLASNAANAQTVVFEEDFGSGASRVSFATGGVTGSTTYTYANGVAIQDGLYAIASGYQSDSTWFGNFSDSTFTDHTGDANGRMMFVNASLTAGEFYRNSFTVAQAGGYSFSVWARSANTLPIKPNVTIRVLDASNAVVGTINTGNLPDFTVSPANWNKYALNITLAPGTYQFVFVNNGPGGNGNDLWLDDIQVSTLTPSPDTGTGISGIASTTIANVRANDVLIDGSPATSANSTISAATSVPAGFTFDTSTGAVSIDTTVAPGPYSFDYELCDLETPTPNCATTTASVTVVAATTDLSITKSDGVTSVFNGETVTYAINVSNNGPDSSTGAVVTDVVGAGLTCPASNPVTITGNGIPSGSFTIADLTGAGITLGTLANGQSATLTYACQVN